VRGLAGVDLSFRAARIAQARRVRTGDALTSHGALFRSPELGLRLSTRCPLEIVDGGDVRARIELRAGETATFVLDRVEPGELPVPYSDADIAAEFDATVAFWRRWLRRSHSLA
jgi:hypothetical protein